MNSLNVSEIQELARRTVLENDFAADFPPEVIEAVNRLGEQKMISEAVVADSSIKDLRELLWSSIDNASSLDLDQVEYAERLQNGDIRVLVGIADVDSFVPKDSGIDRFAAVNTVSIYAGNQVFPMLPEHLSTDLTSLKQDADRLAIVTEIVVCADGDVRSVNIYRAVLHNYAKLSYEETGAWLDSKGAGKIPAKIAAVAGLAHQIYLQREAAERLHEFRRRRGTLEFETVESKPIFENGVIVELQSEKPNSARDIIENFMVTANVKMAEFLEDRNVLSLRRVVRTPERWDRIADIARALGTHLPIQPDSVALSAFLAERRKVDPIHFPDLSLSIIKLLGAGDYVVQKSGDESVDGHFGLAVADYTHSTAPNRRYADLIVQRQVKATIAAENAPYDFDELRQIAAHCNERESAAKKVERKMRKIIAAVAMSSRVGEIFEAIVTGNTPSGTFARILRPPVDGRIVRNEEDLQVGEKIRVKLLKTDPQRGFIDFEFVGQER